VSLDRGFDSSEGKLCELSIGGPRDVIVLALRAPGPHFEVERWSRDRGWNGVLRRSHGQDHQRTRDPPLEHVWFMPPVDVLSFGQR
jgi:hypothetical protein